MTRQQRGSLLVMIAAIRLASATARMSACVVEGPALRPPSATKNGGISSSMISVGCSPISRAHVDGPGASPGDPSQRCWRFSCFSR